MTPRKVSKKVASGVAVTGAAALVATGLLLGSGSSSAVPVSLTLNYTCPFPLIGNQDIKAVITSDLPASVGIGEQTGKIAVKAVTTVSETATQGLTLVGAKTVEGSALAAATVAAPGITLPVNVPIAVEKTNVPASGAFDVNASGEAPSLSFQQAGEAKITVGDLKLTLTPKTADGAETGLGTFESACTAKPGQDNLLHTFTIGGGPGSTTPPPPSSSTTPPPPSSTTPPPPSSTTPPPPSSTTPPPPSSTTPPPPSSTTPPPAGVKVNYAIKGSTTLKNLGGPVPLSGTFNADANLSAGTYVGDLKMNPTKGSFKVFGFLPSDANIKIVPVGQPSGTVKTGAITFDGKINVVLDRLTLFGIPISEGDTCKTTAPSDLKLASTGNFDVLKGGQIKGNYALSSLDGCGFLTPIISALTQASGNTIDLTLTAQTGTSARR
ncbi:DUF6801 domain-containing protein [Actinokineospora sp. G85]|uniref:DUF6801 domain-containing protein n=1 Tax=Actinokineospora sp. G85 TaxID=3406626 RepID=UPI003C70A4F5